MESKTKITNNNEKYFNFANSLLRCSEDLQDRFNKTSIPKERLPVEGAVLCFLFVKSYKTAGAVLLLCRNGYQEDALILVRSIFESALWVLYIFKDGKNVEEKARAFIYRATIERAKKIREVYEQHQEEDQLKRQLEELLHETEREVSKIKEEYQGRAHLLKYGKKNVKELAAETGMVYLYPTFYWESSLYSHSASGSSVPFVIESEKHLHFLAAPADDRTPDVILSLCDFFLRIIKAFDSYFGFEAANFLSAKRAELDKLMNSR